MKIMKSMINYFKPRNWAIFKVYHDIENYLDWKKTILKEEYNKKSKYNIWKLERTKLFDIFLTVSLDENDANLPEIIKRTKVLEHLNPLNRYLDEELGFAGSLNIEFNQFADDKGNMTLTYLIVYRFIFEKLSIKWLIKTSLWLVLIIYIIMHYNLVPIIYTWLSSLI